MKKFILLAALAISSFATAQDYNLYIMPNSGTEKGYELKTLQKLTFESGSINVIKKDGTTAQTISLTDVSKIYFSTTPVGIESMQSATTETVNAKGIYDLTGRKVTNIDLKNGTLPKGIYIKDGKKIVIK